MGPLRWIHLFCMKEKLAIIFNDAHLKTGNEQDVINSCLHMIEYATSNKINNLIFAGDLFDSRSFQRQAVLQAFDFILNEINKAGLTLYIFPGNHDKTLYGSYDSFLDIYKHYPSVEFNRELRVINLEGVSISLLPFFSDDMLIPMLEEAEGTDILISHFEMAGSTHLGKTSEKSTINQKLLSKFKKVYLGHYHNYHEISNDIVHLPSLRQSNFGEDNVKGFTILYKDLSYELVQGKFREYKKIVIDINNTNQEEINKLISEYKNSKNTIRFEFVGQESDLKGLDKKQFKGTGIDVKVKFDAKYNYEASDLKMPEVINKFSKEDIQETFKNFCKEKKYNYEEGLVLLNKFLKDKNEQSN